MITFAQGQLQPEHGKDDLDKAEMSREHYEGVILAAKELFRILFGGAKASKLSFFGTLLGYKWAPWWL